MKEGTRVKVSATGRTGTVVSVGEGLVNVDLDPLHYGHVEHSYHKPEHLELEAAEDSQEEADGQTWFEKNAARKAPAKKAPAKKAAAKKTR